MSSIVRDLLIYAGACVSLGLAMESWPKGILAATIVFGGVYAYGYYRIAADKRGRGHGIVARLVGLTVICATLGVLTRSAFVGIGCGSVAFWLVNLAVEKLQPGEVGV